MVCCFRKTHTKNDVCIKPIADIANIDLYQIYPSKINKLALISVLRYLLDQRQRFPGLAGRVDRLLREPKIEQR